MRKIVEPNLAVKIDPPGGRGGISLTRVRVGGMPYQPGTEVKSVRRDAIYKTTFHKI
ncbi:hypothetical protein A225_3707 [Klebsiella michiganensis E718]|nr:hypothetical protein A225_3707 [Klebsiella michiganensis E718]